MKIKKNHIIIIVGVLIIILLGVVYFTSSASAEEVVIEEPTITAIVVLDEPGPRSIWDDFSNSTMSGYVVDGQSKAIIENITIFEPEGEELFGIPLKFARFKVVSFDGINIVDELLLIGEIGQSDTFFLSYLKMDEPFDLNAAGCLYNVTQHWDETLTPVLVGLYVMESGNLLYTLYGEYEISTGYYIGADVMLGMESAGNRDFLDGKIWGKHNFEPDGSTYGEVFLYNISGSTYYGGGVGFRF